MSEMPSCEAIVNELRDEALKFPDTGWLSDLARRDLTWDGQNEIIIIGAWYGSVDIGHLAAIVESLIDKKTQDLTTRLEQAEQAVERVREAVGILREAAENIQAEDTGLESYSHNRSRGAGYRIASNLVERALDGDTRG